MSLILLQLQSTALAAGKKKKPLAPNKATNKAPSTSTREPRPGPPKKPVTDKPKPKPFNPAIEDEEEKKEFFDKEEDLEAHVKTVAKWMKESKYTIMFTGAGISTR